MSAVSPLVRVMPVENVKSNHLFISDFYEIKNWEYDFQQDKANSKGYNDCLCFVFVRKGNFFFDLSKDSYDMHTGHIVIDKPDYEYKLRPAAGACSIFNFTLDFYKRFQEDMNMKYSFFFSNNNILSLMLRATPEAEYLHHQVMKKASVAGKLEMDNLVLELFNQIISTITDRSIEEEINASLKGHRLSTVERAKEYMVENFSSDISLAGISDHCCVSPFHFSRIFKKYTSWTPHQFLQNVRLKHAEMLLKNSQMNISEISFHSGFNSLEYFATAFRQKYKFNPTGYRSKLA